MDLWVIRTLVKTKKFWAYIRKNGTNLSRYLSYIQIVIIWTISLIIPSPKLIKISAFPDDRGMGGMMIN